jgi:Polyketide cyclase / dehydrase and lipid transport
MAARTSSQIMIAAPRAAVMAVIADFGAYPQWASAVRAAEVLGEEAAGRASQVRFRLDAGIVKDSYVLGYDWDGDEAVRWHLAEPGSVISAMDGGYLLADRGGQTQATYELSVEVRIPMPGLLKRRAEKTIIDTALNGLKARVESRSGQPAGGNGEDSR